MINNGRIQILLRRRQNQANFPLPDDPLIDVVVVGDPLTGEAKYQPGTVDNTTPFLDIAPVDGWYDLSNYIEDEEKMTFTWDKVNQGDSKNSETSKEGSNYDKGISATLFFFDKGFQFIHDWLILYDYQIINCVEVKIIDLIARQKQPDPAGNYRIFEIKADNLDYAPIEEPCQIRCKLREQDVIWHCIHKTAITDDWQGWFNKDGASTFDHPTFLTCIEGRPRLVQSARMALMMFYQGAKTGIFPVALVIDWITGAPSPREDARRIMNANRFIDAPFIKTYIQNVALKCGMTTNTIFDEGRDWANLCLFYPRAGEMHESEDDAIVSPNQHFHYGNRWLITIPDLFDKLKVLFCAEWYVTPLNQIIFEYKKNLLTVAAIYDFTLPDSVPFYDLRYSFNGDKRPAYGEYHYATDPVDEASQEINSLYSDTIGFDTANNPMLEGEVQKNFDFAATGFIRDGRAKDYMRLLINDGEFGALIMLVLLAILSGALVLTSITVIASPVTVPLIAAIVVMVFATASAIAALANSFRNQFEENDTYTGAVRLTAEQTTIPRLLLWDGVATNRAKVVRISQLPVANPYYNPTLINYDVRNIINKDNPTPNIFNYPLYFDGFYYGNMFPNYHDVIDNPLKSKESHQTARFYVDLCEDMQNLLGFFEGQYVQIGKLMKVETRDNYDVFVRIGNILEDYGSNRIEITGQVLRRPVVNGVVIYPPGSQGPGNTPPPDPVPVDPTPPPILPTCFRWVNNGIGTSLVTYLDCDGMLQDDVPIGAGLHFCALLIVSALPDSIVISNACADPDDPDPTPDPETACHRYINLEPDGSIVSYIDCDGVLVVGVPVGFNETFCALEIVSPGCSSLVDIGQCEPCEPCCVPEFISAVTSTEAPIGDCVPIGSFDFLLPDASTGIPYEYRQDLSEDGATPPFSIVPIDIPSWMVITVDPDTNEIVFEGTPDVDGLQNVFFDIYNCGDSGLQNIGTFIFVGTCEDVVVPDDLGFPNLYSDMADFFYRIPITGSVAFALGTIIAPDFFDIIIDNDGFNYFILVTLNRPLTGADEAAGVVLSIEVTNCASGSDSFFGVFDVVAPDSFYILQRVNRITAGASQSIDLLSLDPGVTGTIYWGDGVADPFDSGAGGNLNVTHTYTYAIEQAVQIFKFDTNGVMVQFSGDQFAGLLVDKFIKSVSYTNNTQIKIFGLRSYSDIVFNGSPMGLLYMWGHSESPDVTIDLTTLPSTVHALGVMAFPLLTTIDNIPSTVNNELNIRYMSNLTTIDDAAVTALGFFNLAGLPSLPISEVTSHPNLGNHLFTAFFGNGWTTADVNTVLVYIDSFGTSSKFISITEGGTAPPSGAGATAKANLISRGWSVTTD